MIFYKYLKIVKLIIKELRIVLKLKIKKQNLHKNQKITKIIILKLEI